MADSTDGSNDDAVDIFEEPQGYFKPAKPFTNQSFALEDGREIPLRLVGENPLWGHHLWNGARIVSKYLQQHADALIHDRTVLELGAGAGLPSLVCAILGAKRVVVTDYPDADLIANLRHNISTNPHLPRPNIIHADGYLWGTDASRLIQFTNTSPNQQNRSMQTTHRFDTLILADVLFNHSEHVKLVVTVRCTLARTTTARTLVFFTPYRPWLLQRDLAFFDLIEESNGWSESEGRLDVRKIAEVMMDKVMFEEDPGDEALRKTVFGYEIFWTEVS